MITSKFPSGVDGDGWLANMEITIVRNAPSQNKFRFIGRLTVANTAIDAKCFGVRRYVAAVQKVPLISSDRRPIRLSDSNRTETAEPRTRLPEKRGKSELKKGDDLMKTTMKSKRRSAALLSILCAGLVAMFLGGCADTPYVAYGPGYYPTAYYTGYEAYPYSYYGPAYDTTVVRAGVRYNDAYGPRYYTRTVYGDW